MPRKTKPLGTFFGSLGVAGTPAAGFGGWSLYDHVRPTPEKAMERSGYHWKPASLDFDARQLIENKDQNNKFSTKGDRCFSGFFPDVELSFELDSAHPGAITKTNPPNRPSSGLMGCSMMQLFHDKTGQKKFVFVSETTISDGNVGWVVWANATNTKFAHFDTVGVETTGVVENLQYMVLFLEKENKQWSIKGGLHWDDYLFTTEADTKIKISSPDKAIDQTYEAIASGQDNEASKVTDWEIKKYSGVWRSDEGGREPFEQIEVAALESGKADSSPEILGKKGTFAASGDDPSDPDADDEFGYWSIGWHFSPSQKKWISTKGIGSGTDGAPMLTAWYAPFEDKRGSWTHVEDYCRSKYRIRGQSADTVRLIRELCYTKNI